MLEMITMPIALGLVFAAVLVVALTAQSYVAERRALYRSLRNVRTIELGAGDVRKQELAQPIMRRIVFPSLRAVGRGIRRFTPSSVIERLDQELVYAGNPAGWDGERVLAVKVVISAVLFMAALVSIPVLDLQVAQGIILAPILGIVGYYAPEWVLRSQSGKRQREIQLALPDSLDLMSITVEAGLGFDAAVERVAKRMGGALGEELYRVVQEMRLGKSRSEALRDLGERTSVQELRSFVLAMVQADIFGIAIGQVLKVQAREMRIKRRQRAEEQAQKIPVKIVVPLIFCIFPALFVVILGPAVITIMEQFAGR